MWALVRSRDCVLKVGRAAVSIRCWALGAEGNHPMSITQSTYENRHKNSFLFLSILLLFKVLLIIGIFRLLILI